MGPLLVPTLKIDLTYRIVNIIEEAKFNLVLFFVFRGLVIFLQITVHGILLSVEVRNLSPSILTNYESICYVTCLAKTA